MVSLALPMSAARADSLCLYSFPENEAVQTYQLPDTGRFALSFIHSVSGTPVVDQYRLTANTMTQTAEIFEAHGAGLPSLRNELDASDFRHENGKFILELNRPIDKLIVRVQSEYDNTLLINTKSIELATLGHTVLRLSGCTQEPTHD